MDHMTRPRAVGSGLTQACAGPLSGLERSLLATVSQASKAPRNHCNTPLSMATTSNRQGGGAANRNR